MPGKSQIFVHIMGRKLTRVGSFGICGCQSTGEYSWPSSSSLAFPGPGTRPGDAPSCVVWLGTCTDPHQSVAAAGSISGGPSALGYCLQYEGLCQPAFSHVAFAALEVHPSDLFAAPLRHALIVIFDLGGGDYGRVDGCIGDKEKGCNDSQEEQGSELIHI